MRSGSEVEHKKNVLIKCDKCECQFSDSSENAKCIVPVKPSFHTSSNSEIDRSSGDGNECACTCTTSKSVVLQPTSCSSLKIIVRAQIVSNDDFLLSQPPSNSNSLCKPLNANFSMTKVCFRFCRKKKENKDVGTNMDDLKLPQIDDIIQTSTVTVPEPKPKEAKDETTEMEPNLKDIFQMCGCRGPPVCPVGPGGGGGCNTNTIIFPRDRFCSEKVCNNSLTDLETCIKMESRNHTRSLEEILNELYKLKREVHEIRDLLDVVVRTMREQVAFGTYCAYRNTCGKPSQDNKCEDECKTNYLERKTNSLSLTAAAKNSSPVNSAVVAPKATPGPSKKSSVVELSEPPAIKITTLAPSMSDKPNKKTKGPSLESLVETPEEKPKKKGLFSWRK